MGLVRALGAVCRELREQAEARHDSIGYHIQPNHGRDKRSLEAFENGKQPDYLDEVLNAYATELGVPVLAICRLALERLEAQATPPEQALPDALQEPLRRRSGTSRKRVSKRKRPGAS